MSESRFYHITQEGKLVHIAALEDALVSVKREGGFLWLDYCQPSKEELSALMEPLGLHPLSIEDCLDENQIPKIEDYPRNTFVLFNTFTYTQKTLTIGEIDFFLGDNFLVTVGGLSPNGQPALKGAEHSVELDLGSARQGPAFLAHVILDRIVDQKFMAIEALEDDLDTAEDTILADHQHFNPAELVRLRRDLVTLRKSLFHEREILVKICRKDCLFISDKAIYYYRDIYDHLAKSFELTESFRDLVTSLMEMYLSTINNHMTMAANETNIIVRRLTFITTIFMPLTLLAGIGGMSEWSMMTGPSNWHIAYPAFLLGMVVLGVANYFVLKWLERNRAKTG